MKTIKIEKTDNEESRTRILSTLGVKEMTINEIIDSIYWSDVRYKRTRFKSWKYYVHLNKLFNPMLKAGLIEITGSKIGETKRLEKTWRVKSV